VTRACRLACLIGAVALATLAAAPASAEQSWLERLFSGNKAPEPAPTPVAAPPAKPATPKTAPAKAAAPAASPGQPAAARPAAARAASPAPPVPAAARTAAPAAAASAAPAIVTAAAPDAQAPALPLSPRQVVERANLYFNGISSLTGSFVQIGGDGRRLAGKLYLQRPGKIRFEYNAPATLEVIADGSSVAVRDRKLATQDLFSIGQTPLKFLLRDRVDLGKDIKVVDAGVEGEEARIALEDRSTIGGTSKITLFFDRNVQVLNRWRIVDPQGFQTTVALSDLDRSRRVDPRLFVINYERVLGESSNR